MLHKVGSQCVGRKEGRKEVKKGGREGGKQEGVTKPSLDSPASGEDTVPSSSLTFLASTHVQRSRNILREREAELLRTPPPHWGFPGGSEDKASACKAGDLGSIPGSGRSPGEGEKEMEKEMATHSSILAWRIPWTEEPGGLQSPGSQRVGHD